MDCHQILSGACNVGDKCFAIGSVEGINFTVSAFFTSFYTVETENMGKQFRFARKIVETSGVESEL